MKQYIVEVAVDGQGTEKVWTGKSLTEGRKVCKQAAKESIGGLDCPRIGPHTEGIEIMTVNAPGNYPGYAVLIELP